MREYSVLRKPDLSRTAEPFGLHTPRAFMVTPAPIEVRIERADLTASEVRDLARDPAVAAIAPIMPTTLIKPIEAKIQEADLGWGIAAVGANTSPFSGAGVTIAVLDTGIDKAHPAFAGVNIVEKDFSGSGNGDRAGHGTHCAGTIFGRDVDQTRIGVARGVSHALIGKVLSDDGSGDSDMIFRGLQWAMQERAQVVSMSLGFDFPGMVKRMTGQEWPEDLATSVALEAYRANLRMFDSLMEVFQAHAAFDGGAVIVAAAGNESRRELHPNYEIAASLPAAAEGVVSVGALAKGGPRFTLADFSNTFPQVCGPGVNVRSAKIGGGLVSMHGTSMACPHVAGVAALWWEALRQSAVRASAMAVVDRLLTSARTDVIAAEVDQADRGFGLAFAPQEAV